MTHWFAKNISVVTILGVVATLSGCQAMFPGLYAPYVSVQSGPRAEITISKSTVTSDFDAIVFVPDANCKFGSIGRNWLTPKGGINEMTFYVPPGRSYFRVWAAEPGFGTLDSQDISFVVEEGEEYLFEYTRGETEFESNDPLGLDPLAGGTRTVGFDLNYLQIDGSERKPLEIDHWEICDRN